MKRFKEYTDEQLLKEELLIQEFANMGSKAHKFGVDVRLHIMQPADKQLQHAPRVKIYRKGVSGSFSISITDNPKVIGDWNDYVSKSELNILITKIKHYKDAFLEFWNDPDMDIYELEDLFSQIDRGFTVRTNK